MSGESLSRASTHDVIVLSNPTESSPRFRFGRLVRRRWFPFGRRQGGDVGLVRHRRKPGGHIFDGDERIDAVVLARHAGGINDRRALARLGVADEQPVLFPQRRRPDGVFDQIVVEAAAAVLANRDEYFPVLEQGRRRLGRAAIWATRGRAEGRIWRSQQRP